MVALGKTIEEFQRPIAEAAKAANGGDKKSKRCKSDRGTSPIRSRSQDESKRTSSVAAAACGIDRRTYEKAKAEGGTNGGKAKHGGNSPNLASGGGDLPSPFLELVNQSLTVLCATPSNAPTACCVHRFASASPPSLESLLKK